MIITFDIGGTAIKYGIINSSESFIYKHSIPTQANLGGHAIIFRLIALINELKKPYDITGVAISSAGVIDAIKGIVLSATDAIPNYVGLNIKQIIETETLLPVTVENDVKCLALSELAYGNHEVDTFLTMTIGTGIGGAIVMDGKLFKGHRLSAGEWGHMIINHAPYESVGSLSGLVQLSRDEGLKCSNGFEVFKRFDEGDAIAKKVVSQFYSTLATGIANLIYAFNPPLIIIGGGISNRQEKFIHELSSELKKIVPDYYYESCTLKLATHYNDAGMLGAYAYFKEVYQK